MKRKRNKKIAAYLAAALITFSTAAQSFSVSAAVDTTKTDIDLTYERFDPQLIKDAGEKLKEACSKKDNKDEVIACCNEICTLYYKYNTAGILSSIMQSNNENIEEYIYESSIVYDVEIALSDALYIPLNESEYSDVIADVLTEPIKVSVEEFHGNDDNDNTAGIKAAEYLNSYNQLLATFLQGDIPTKEFELKCAEIYLNLIKIYKDDIQNTDPELSLEEFFNENYNRDYSYEDIEKCKENISNTVSYLSNYIMQTIQSVIMKKDINQLIEYLSVSSEDLDIIKDIILKYTPELSEEFAKNAQYIIDADLLFKGSPTSNPSGFTASLPEFNTPLMYISAPSDSDSIIFTVHEFGHFNSFCNSDFINNPSDNVNLDIAEVQSQGMEILFLNYYDEIFGEYSDYLKVYELSRLLSVLQLGCYVNDFEHEVFQDPESFTPEQIVDLFHEKQLNYGIAPNAVNPFGMASNYFTSPYYCISYSMSLLPALKLLEIDAQDHEKAKNIYYDYTKIDAYDPENRFLESLEKANFGNILDNDYIDSMRCSLGDYLDSVDGIINGDISGDGNVSAEDLIMLKKIMLQDIEEYDWRVADINRDGQLTASDLAELVYKISQ